MKNANITYGHYTASHGSYSEEWWLNMAGHLSVPVWSAIYRPIHVALYNALYPVGHPYLEVHASLTTPGVILNPGTDRDERTKP